MGPDARRLHPAGILVYALQTLREAAFPLIAVFLVGILGSGLDEGALARGALFATIGAVVAAVGGYVRWSTTSYRLTEDGIHHRRGVISIKETDVPLSRIQALDVEQGPVQRAFGVQALHVQTGGGGAGGEIVLDAVGPGEVRRLRDVLGERRPEAALQAPAPEVARRLSRSGLVATALTAGQIGVLLPVLAAGGQLLQTVVGERGERGEEAIRLLPDSASEWAVAAAVLLGLAWLLSIAGAVVAFAGFTASRAGDRLRIRRGLLARREATIPVERVRAVEVIEGLLRRPFGLAALRIEVIGHAKEPTAAQTLFPLLRRAEVRAFLDELLPELADDLDGLAAPPRRALRRYVLPWAVAGLPLLALTPWALLLSLLGAAYGALRYRAAGWRLAGGRLAVRSLVFARTTVLAPAANRESHSLSANVLQRRAGLADVSVAFGKTTRARVRHLEAPTARRLWENVNGGH